MPPTLCIHCLAAPAEEKDHVLPRSWYPDETSPTVQRLTVPSCKACGARLKKGRGTDGSRSDALGGSITTTSPLRACTSACDRTWDVNAPGSPRAFKYRRDRIYSVMSRARSIVVSPSEAVGAARVQARTAPGVWGEAAVALKFRREDIHALIGKFVRGLHYHRTGTSLPADARITAFDPPPEAMQEAAQLPDRGSLSEGPGDGWVCP